MRSLFRHSAFRNPSVLIGGGILLVLLAVALLAPLLTQYDPLAIAPRFRLKAPSDTFLMGTDMLGRDIWTRVVFGGRVSLLVSAVVAVLAISIGLTIGLVAGYIRWLDGPVMRAMDGLMAIPGILLAIALVSLSGASLITVIIAIVIPEIPRVARLVRGVVLSIREEPYVEAAIGLGTPTIKILIKHILPNTIAPLIVQGTYICASAILVESILSFLGAGLPPEIPTWGNIIAEGRSVFQRAPWIILFPGSFLAVTILAVNILGDGLRDTLDPRMKKRLGA
jgi:peptide/nickel transport system permease protein